MKKIIFLTAFFILLRLMILGSFYSYGKYVDAIASNTRFRIESPIAAKDTEADQNFEKEERRERHPYHYSVTGKGSVQTDKRFYAQLLLDGGTDPYTGRYYPPGNEDGSIDPYTGKFYPRGNEDGNIDPYTGRFYPQGDDNGRIDPYTGRYYPQGNEDVRIVPKTERRQGGR